MLIDFHNKLELRYQFSDSSNYIDAQIRYRCEGEILNILLALAELLDIRLQIYNEPFSFHKGFCERWLVAGKDRRAISVILNQTLQFLREPTLTKDGKLIHPNTTDDEKELRRIARRVHLNLQQKEPDYLLLKDLREQVCLSIRFCRFKSNFYEALRGYPRVTKIQLRETNAQNLSKSGLVKVQDVQFPQFILKSGKLEPITDNKALIQIISPVLSNRNFQWKGLYNKTGLVIDFSMQDEEFKKQLLEEKLSFTNGVCIECIMEISRRITDLGKTVNSSYAVKTVIRTRLGKEEMVTPQGKRHLRKLEGERKQLSFDFF